MSRVLRELPVVGSLFETPEPPRIVEPTVAPTADPESLKKARQRTAAQQRGGGRISTFLTQGAGKKKLGG